MADHYLRQRSPLAARMGGNPARRALPSRSRGRKAPIWAAWSGTWDTSCRRAQIWIFQDFIRTLAEVNIRPAQYSVLIVIEANHGLSQSALSQTLGIERARLVRLLDSLEARKFVQRRRSRLIGARMSCR